MSLAVRNQRLFRSLEIGLCAQCPCPRYLPASWAASAAALSARLLAKTRFFARNASCAGPVLRRAEPAGAPRFRLAPRRAGAGMAFEAAAPRVRSSRARVRNPTAEGPRRARAAPEQRERESCLRQQDAEGGSCPGR